MLLKELESFVGVAETLSFTAAARQLDREQTDISKQVKQLERQFGMLFERSPVHLTELGEALTAKPSWTARAARRT